MTALLLALLSLSAAPNDCNASPASPSMTVGFPLHPFGVALTPDGCTVFVATGNGPTGNAAIEVLKRADGQLRKLRTIPLKQRPALGLALTHDTKVLIVSALDHVVLLDVPRLISGDADPVLCVFSDGSGAGSIAANTTADDRVLFVSDERKHGITVLDLARTLSEKKPAVIGVIPTGTSPIALVFSPDEKWLYSTAQIALPDWGWPIGCSQEGGGNPTKLVRPEGAVVVIDVARARSDPASSVTARIPAGCSTVRAALSPKGDRLYTTARNSNAVLAFDTARLQTDGAHARIGSITVGQSPVPVAVIDNGARVIAGNSSRFGPESNKDSDLTVLDAGKFDGHSDPVLGSVPAGAFPREMALSPDGRTLFVTNFNSKSLQMLDLNRLPLVRTLKPQ
jgi:DNA-binding beta-propeller fold protein YncE